MEQQSQQLYIPVRRSQINYYREVPLYYRPATDRYALYKPSGNVTEVKTTLCNLVEETLAEPRSGTLKALPETVDTLVSGYS